MCSFDNDVNDIVQIKNNQHNKSLLQSHWKFDVYPSGNYVTQMETAPHKRGDQLQSCNSSAHQQTLSCRRNTYGVKEEGI